MRADALALYNHDETQTNPQVVSSAKLAEQQPVDETGRPEWTSARRFTTTRVYLQNAPWEVSFEQWWRFRDLRDNSYKSRFVEELTIGLPYRLQLDLYEKWVMDDDRRSDHEEFSMEMRWALADWGKIPLNPTIYAEYAFVNQGADVLELKLLLGETIAPRINWGVNFVFEKELGDGRASAFQATQGLSYTLIDQKLSAGVEMKYVYETEHGSRGEPEQQFLIGPSIQVRPTLKTHLDLVALIGANHDAPSIEAYVVFGFDFGKITGPSANPVSVRPH